MTPSDAKGRFCMWAIAPGDTETEEFRNGTNAVGKTIAMAGVNRDPDPHGGTHCLADGCMAWSWQDPGAKTQGFCSYCQKNKQDWR